MLTPKRYNHHPHHFYMGLPLPHLGPPHSLLLCSWAEKPYPYAFKFFAVQNLPNHSKFDSAIYTRKHFCNIWFNIDCIKTEKIQFCYIRFCYIRWPKKINIVTFAKYEALYHLVINCVLANKEHQLNFCDLFKMHQNIEIKKTQCVWTQKWM